MHKFKTGASQGLTIFIVSCPVRPMMPSVTAETSLKCADDMNLIMDQSSLTLSSDMKFVEL